MYPTIKILGTSVDTYFVFLSLLFSLIVPLIVYRATKKSYLVNTALDLYLVVLISSFLGARLFYIIYQEPGFYFSNPLEMLYFWKGGFVFFGGFLGGFLGGFAFLKFKKLNWLDWANFSSPLLALGYGLGRISCFLAGCCYGAPTDAWFGIHLHSLDRHPAQLYAVFWELAVFLILVVLEKKKYVNLFFIWMLLHGFGRIFMEFFRDDPRGDALFGLSISAVVSLVLIIIASFELSFHNYSKEK